MFNFTKKRAISLILVIAMLLGSLPADTLRLFSWAADEIDYSGDVEKYAELNETVTNITVLDRENGIESTFLHEDFAEGTILCIADWYQDADAKLWYLVTFYSGGVVGDYADGWPANPWVSADALVFVDCCAVCGKPDCTTEHSTKPVTVQGNLPEDATVSYTPVTDAAVLEELGIKNGFAADISILSGGAKWQPDAPVTVTLKTTGNYAAIRHYLDDVDAVTAGLADGSAMVMDISGKSDAVKTLLADAIEAYQSATNTTDEMVAMEWITDVTDNGDGTISFVTDSMSVYAADTAGYLTGEKSTITITDATDFGNNIYYAGAYKITPGTITITDGSTQAVTWYLYWNDAATAYGQSNSPDGDTISNDYVSLDPGTPQSMTNWIANYDATLTVNDTASTGDYIQVNMSGKNGRMYFVQFYVVKEIINITFNTNGGTVEDQSSVTKTASVGSQVTLPIPVRDGYGCTGWYTESTGGTRVGYAGDTYTVQAGMTTLYAQWAKPVNVTYDANGGTVNGSTTYVVSVTPGVTTVMPIAESWTDSEGVTYYFDGWYTAPTDGTPVGEININKSAVQETAKYLIFEHAFTEETTVYAHWTKYKDLANSQNFIMIGLINNYYISKENGGGYPISGTTWESYHQFPNEPSGIGHDQTYRVDDRSEGWTLKLDGKTTYPLAGSPFDYIDASILSADAYYKNSPIAGDNTKGVFDADGSDVYYFLKLSEEDKKQIIEAWLEVIISEKDNYEDGTVAAQVKADLKNYYEVDFTGKTAADLVDDFQLIPYVVKHHPDRVGEIGWWVIDMVIIPVTEVTLSYDINVPAGYSLTAGAAPNSKTYTLTNPVTMADVVVTPDVTVSKVVGDNTVYATFSHWVDEAGNTYGGNTDNNKIAMDDNKLLTAVWIINENIPGSLTVTKTIKVDAGYVKPDRTPEFSFVFNIDTTNCVANDPYIKDTYSYTIYNGGTIVSTGTIGNIGKFTLQDGWAIHIENLPAGAKITVTETDLPTYFIPAKTEEVRDISAGQNTSLVFTNAYPRVYYTVEHYLQPNNLSTNLADYVKQKDDTQTLVGTVGEQTAASAMTYAGYAAKSFSQETISADGNTVVKIYYDRTITSLTIKKVTMDGENVVDYSTIDPNQSFIFNISGDGVDQDVVVHGSDWDVVIDGLTVGATYTVTEKTGWSWRYGFKSWAFVTDGTTDANGTTNRATITLGASGNEITFTNSRSNQYWLDGDSWCNNIFK